MAFRLERFYQTQGIKQQQQPIIQQPIINDSIPNTDRPKVIKSNKSKIDEEYEETIFDKIINDKPSTKKLREILKDHIEELEEINDNH